MTEDLTAWLGPAADELTTDQRARFDAEAERITARYPDDDHQGERDAALSAAVQYLLGETKPADARRVLTEARRVEREAMAAAQQVAVMLADDGATEEAAGAAVGVTRLTVRAARGKL